MIGSALIREALSQGIGVLALVHPGSARVSSLPQSPLLKIAPCGIQDYPDYVPEEKYDLFFHLAWNKTFGAARDDTTVQVNNIHSTLEAVKLASRAGCSAFIGTGSQAEYGPTESSLNEKTPVNPLSGYGIAKYAAGKFSRLLCTQLGLRQCWVRILSIYGERDAAHTLIMYCISQLLKGEKPSLTNCDQVWDYLYCGDAAKALLAIGSRGKDGRIYCLGSGNAQPLKQYILSIRDAIDPELPLGFGEKEYYPNQPMYLRADISDLKRDTGFLPATDFSEGIRRTIKWYKEEMLHEKN